MANPFDQFDEPSMQGNPFDQFDEVEKPKAGFGVAFKKALASAGNAMESAISLPAGALANYAGFQEQGDEIFRTMDANREARNKWANPDNLETTAGQDILGMAASFPAQVFAMPGQAAEKGMDLIQRGEPLSTAIPATLADAGMNAAGVGPMQAAKTFLGRAAIGTAGNVALGAGSDAATQLLATKDTTKAAYDPYDPRRRFQDALVGGITQGFMGERPTAPKTPSKGLNTLSALDALAEAKKVVAEPAPVVTPEQLHLFDQFEERSPISPYQTEMAPDMWRVDENGIPIRADLSMEVQNLQQPLQRNLFGDELDVNFPRDPNKPLDMETGDIPGTERFSDPVQFRNDPEGQRPLTEAIDMMPEGVRNRVNGKFAEGTTRQSALDLLRGELPASPDLEVARMDAETAQWLEANKRPPVEKTPLGSKARKAALARVGRAKGQGGGVTTDIFGRTPERSGKLHDVAEFLPYRFQVLEAMPNKDVFTGEQLRSALNREGVSAQEKHVLTLAWDIARSETGTAPDGSLFVGKAKATEFVDALNTITEKYSLSKTPSDEYATYGLDRLGRDAGERWEPIPRNEWTEAQRQENIDYNVFPERKVQTSAGVEPATNVWGNESDLSSQSRNHFDDPQYVGHTRNFKEDGVRHVVEIQSDLLQKAPPEGGVFQEFHGIPDSMLQDRFDTLTRKIEQARKLGIDDEDLYNQKAQLRAELTTRTEAASKANTIKGLQKNWHVRLIREELADAARQRETSVRFATADTMAKVEGWENKAEYWRGLAKDMLRQVKAIDEMIERNPARNSELLSADRVHYLKEAQDAGQKVLDMEKSGKKFDEQVQGIYDRYQKDVAKYLKSIGGKEVTDAQGHTWLEVPVDQSRKRPIMFGQRGAVLFDWKQKPEMDQLKKVAGIRERLANFIPTNATPDDVVAVAKGMKDVDQNVAQRAINTFTKGGLYQAEKTNNPIIKFTVDKVLNADRLARADVRDYIHDSLAPAMRDLSKAEMTEIATVLNHADKVQVPVTPEFLRNQGFSEKQIAFAEAHRQTMDASFDAINRAREAAGLDPISKRVAYAAMNFTGDYRKLVYTLDEDGNKTVVGAIGAKTAWGLKGIEKQLKKANPEYVIEAKPRYMGGNAGEKGGSAVLAVQQALSLLAENDPNTKAFLDVMEQIKTSEAYDYLNTRSHTKAKKGVFGAEGRKPWESAEQNAKDFMDAQLQYAEAALKWGHLSDAANDVKKVLASDVDMPNAKQWSEQYLQNALGINPSATGRAFEKAVNQFWESSGIGRTIPAKTQMYSRKAVNTMLLGLNPGFLAANLVQPMLSLPAMTTFLKGRGIDALTTGYDSTFKAGLTLFKEKVGKLSDLEQAAVKYAHDNHVFGSDLVDTSNISRKNAEFYLDKTGNFLASNVESGTRKLVYYSFVHMLNDNGLGRDFGLAQNLTDIAMNNYSPVERPQVFNALGPVGDLAANLSSFKHNELSRLAMFAREVGNDANAAPFLMQIATQVAAAGMTGTIAFAEADWLYRQITKAFGAPDSLSRVVIDFSEGLTENAKGKYLASHGVFSALGIDMSKRLGISDVIPDSLPEAMFPGGSKLVDVGAAGLSAISNPDELNLKRFAREAAPGVMTGPMDRAWFSKDTPQGELAINRRTLKGQVIRDEADKMAKNLGFTGIHESVEKQKLFDLQQRGIGYQELRNAVFKKMTNQMFTTGKVDPKLIENYAKYEGDMSTLETALERFAKESSASMVDLAKLRAVAARSLPQQKQGQRVMEAFNE